MRKIITYIFSGAYYIRVGLREFSLFSMLPIVRFLLIIIFSLLPIAKRNFKKRGITMKQHIDESFSFCKNMERNDILGKTQSGTEFLLTIVLSLFFLEIIMITKRILNIEKLNYILHNGEIAVICICLFSTSFLVSGIVNYILKGKRLQTLEYKPKKYKIKSLLAFFAFSIATVAIFIILCETS